MRFAMPLFFGAVLADPSILPIELRLKAMADGRKHYEDHQACNLIKTNSMYKEQAAARAEHREERRVDDSEEVVAMMQGCQQALQQARAGKSPHNTSAHSRRTSPMA